MVHEKQQNNSSGGESKGEDKPSSSKTPQTNKTEAKTLKRKLFAAGGTSEDEDTPVKKATPKRRRSIIAGEGSPTPGSTPKTPSGIHRHPVPMSERQQLALVMQMTLEETAQGDSSPRPSSPHTTPGSSAKKTALEKKVNKPNEKGETQLHLAAIRGEKKLAKKLISAGAEVNVKDYAGWTPLHEACNHGWFDVAKCLLRAGANVNVQGYDNDTPLHDASINGHRKLVELLLKHGANPLQQNKSGQAPLDVATNPEIVKLLKSEIIASSSSSSSQDEVRSPTSPESNASDKEEDHKSESQDSSNLISSPNCSSTSKTDPSHSQGSDMLSNQGSSLHSRHPSGTHSQGLLSRDGPSTSHVNLREGPSSQSTSPMLKKKVHMSHHMDKSSSPRLTLIFQHKKQREKRTSGSPQRPSKMAKKDCPWYRVTLSNNEEYEFKSSPGSPAQSTSSQDSDLYDPKLEPGLGLSRSSQKTVPDSVGSSDLSSKVTSSERHESLNAFSSLHHFSHKDTSGPADSQSFSTADRRFTSKDTSNIPKSTTRIVNTTEKHNSSSPDRLYSHSGPFPPQFEDISDDDSESMDVDSTTHSQTLPSHIPQTIDKRHLVSSSISTSSVMPNTVIKSEPGLHENKQVLYTAVSSSSNSIANNIVSASPSHRPSNTNSSASTRDLHSSSNAGSGSSRIKIDRTCFKEAPSNPLSNPLTELTKLQEGLGSSNANVGKESTKLPPKPDSNKFSNRGDSSRILKHESKFSPRQDSKFGLKTETSRYPHLPKQDVPKHSPKQDGSKVIGKQENSRLNPSKMDLSKVTPKVEREVGSIVSGTPNRHSPKSEKETRTSPKGEHDSKSPKSDKDGNSPKLFGSKIDKDKTPSRTEKERQGSPKMEKEEKTSPKLEKESRWSPKMDKDSSKLLEKSAEKFVSKMDVYDFGSPKSDKSDGKMSPRMSPRSDRSDRDNRPTSPKVPPLKIILPHKQNSNPGDAENIKTLLDKSALPYVLNPTQEAADSTGNRGEHVTLPTGKLVIVSTQSAVPSGSSNENNQKVEPMETETVKSDQSVPMDTSTTESKETSAVTSSRENVTPSVVENNHVTTRKTRERNREQKDTTDSDRVSDSGSNKDSEAGSNKDSSSKEKDEGKEKESKEKSDKKEDEDKGERRMTRSVFRSQQQQQESSSEKEKDKENHKEKEKEKESVPKEKDNGSKSNSEDVNMHPRKRKLRPRPEGQNENVQPPQPIQQHQHEKTENPYQLFLGIRKQVLTRRNHWYIVQPKAPSGFKDYLMVSCNYVIEGKSASTLSVPTLSPPNSVTGPMRDLYVEQEKARYRLRLQHVIEREKLMLSTEQEIVRVHGRAARALANQSTPLSACSILKDEEIYNPLEPDQEEKDRTVRSRYNGRQFISWLQDVDDKFEKIKESLLLRHHHEAESLHAVQKLEWEWKLKEVGLCDYKTTPAVDDLHVPMVQVNDDFDLLPP